MLSWIKRLPTPSWPTLLVLAGALLVILCAKGSLIHRFGSDLPYMDQWDAEAQMLLIPAAEGKLGVENFIAPHNEHRIVLTKLLNFSLTQLNGQWSPLLEMSFGALLHVCAIGTLLCFARKQLSAPAFAIVACFAALLFALSYAWENTLQGFQSQFYLLMWSALAGIWLMAGAHAMGKRWWWGFAVMIAGLGSMSSGFVAAATVGALLVLRCLVERRWDRRDFTMLAALALACIAGVLLTRHVPGHDSLRAATIAQLFSSFFSCLAWPMIEAPSWALMIQIPSAILAFTCLRRRELRSPDAVILTFSLWCWLQLAALSYARGHMSPTFSPRYTDMMAVGLLVNAIALGRIWSGWAERLRPLVVIAWVLTTVPALLNLSDASSAYLSSTFSANRARETLLIKEFLRTQDEAILRSAPIESLPHPNAGTIISVLRHPGMQTLQPAGLRAEDQPVKQGVLSLVDQYLLARAESMKSVGLILIMLGLLGICRDRRTDFAALLRQIGIPLRAGFSMVHAWRSQLGASALRTWPVLGNLSSQDNLSSSTADAASLSKKFRAITVLAFASVVLLTLGAKFGVIHRFGSDLPFMDTWDAQADRILIPYSEGRLTAQAFWEPHNEHHVLWTRLLNFGLAVSNRQWDPKLECTANAFIIATLAGALLLFARRQLRGMPFLLVAAVLGLLFALPFGYENTLYGFQSQFYFLSLSAFGSLWLCIGAKPFGLRWCAGIVVAMTGLASMASGFLAPAALVAVMCFQFLLEKRLTLRSALGAGAACLVTIVGILWIHPVPLHAELHAQTLTQFVSTLLAEASWPNSTSLPLAVLMQVPVFLLFVRACRNQSLNSWDAVVLGLAIWSWLQFGALAFARGAVSIQECPRYEDLFILGVVANALSLARILEGGSRRGWTVLLAGTWLACLIVGTAPQWERFSRGILPDTAAQRASTARKLRPYLRTHDAALYAKISDEDLPYPSRVRLKEFLDNPGLQPLWPVSLRPATILRPATGSHGFVLTTRQLAQDQPNEPVWSADEGPALFVSAPLPEKMLPVLQFRFRGSSEMDAGAITILSADGVRHPLKASRMAGHRWQSTHLALPDAPGPLRIIVEIPAGRHQFAFADPIEMGRLSWIAKYVLGAHAMLTWAGLLLAASALAILTRLEPPGGGYLRAVGSFLSWCAASPGLVRNGVAAYVRALIARSQSTDAVTRAPLMGLGAAFIAIALFLRRPDALLLPQIWAEDGCVFLLQQSQAGWHAILTPYAGYLHLIPRLITEAVSHLDPRFWPLAFNGCSFLIWCFVCLRCWSPRLDLPGKVWLPVAIIIAPQTVEVLFNITNIQWVTALILFQQAFMRDPETTFGKALELVLFTLVSLTGPFIVLLMPLLAWSTWRRRSPYRIALFAIGLAATFTQLYMAIFHPLVLPHAPFAVGNIPHLVAVMAQRMSVLVIPSGIAMEITTLPMLLLGALFVALWISSRKRATNAIEPWMAASLTACLILAAAALRVRPDDIPLHMIGYGERYFILPRILVGWIVIWIAVGSSPWRHAAHVFALLAILSQAPLYHFAPLDDLHWERSCEALRKGQAVDVPIHPGWILHYPGRRID